MRRRMAEFLGIVLAGLVLVAFPLPQGRFPLADHLDHVEAIAVIDGEKNPELIPDVVAYSLVFRLVAGRQTEEEVQRIRAYVRRIGLSEAGIDAFLRMVEEFHQQVSVLDRQAREIQEHNRPRPGPSALEQLRRLQHQKDTILTAIIANLPARLEVAEAEKVQKFVREHVKRRVKIRLYNPVLAATGLSAPLTAFAQTSGQHTEYSDAWEAGDDPWICSNDECYTDASPDFTRSWIWGAGVTEDTYDIADWTTVSVTLRNPAWVTSSQTSGGYSWARAETSVELDWNNPNGDVGDWSLTASHRCYVFLDKPILVHSGMTSAGPIGVGFNLVDYRNTSLQDSNGRWVYIIENSCGVQHCISRRIRKTYTNAPYLWCPCFYIHVILFDICRCKCFGASRPAC